MTFINTSQMENFHPAQKHKIASELKHLIMSTECAMWEYNPSTVAPVAIIGIAGVGGSHFIIIDTRKDKDTDKANSFLLVIPEKYEPIIFNTYHDSLLAGHQGPYHTAMTIRQKFFIHNLMNKVKRYIEACHTCLKTKPKYMKNRPIYGRIPVDYAPMQDLSIDIKTMPQAFGGYHLLLVITCNQTNFTIAVPLRDRTAQTIAEALIYRVIYLFGPPRQIISDEATEFTSAIIQAILCMLNCRLKVISPYNHGSSKCERQM